MKFNELKKLYRENALAQSDILQIPRSDGLEVYAVPSKSVDVIRRIFDTMCRLAPMGGDELRTLWVEVKGKRWEWYRISTSVYNDCHYLFITGDEFDHHVLCDKADVCNARSYWFGEDEIFQILSKIEKFIVNLIDNIISDSSAYNTYVDKYLSYYRRKGLIKRSVLNSLIQYDRYPGIDIPRAINIYEAQAIPTQFSEMTLRQYMRVWRIAYEAVYGKITDASNMEVFCHSSKGDIVDGYDINSEADFKRWEDDVFIYHGFDVVYARVHLFPRNDNGKWHFYVGTHSYWNLDQCLQAVLGLADAGISVELGEADQILGILKETDYIEITQYAYRYMQRENVGSQMTLPYPDENISKETIKNIITNTVWESIETVKPL